MAQAQGKGFIIFPFPLKERHALGTTNEWKIKKRKMYSALNAGGNTPSLETIRLCSLPTASPPGHVQRRYFRESLQEAKLAWSCSLLYIFSHGKGNIDLFTSSDICKVCF